MRRRFALALALIAALPLLLVAEASAARSIQVGFADDVYADNLLFGPDDEDRSMWARRMAGTNAELVRLNLYWSRVVSTSQPFDPENPDSTFYDWTEVDRAVKAADEAGIDVVFTVLSAPRFAEGPNRPSAEEARIGTWKPDPEKFKSFAIAAATRYSGSHPDPAGGTLPRVEYWEGWNEPNLQLYINPQRNNKDKNKSPGIYRKLLNGFYDGVKSVDPSMQVLAAGTSPFGDVTGARRIPPVEFWRSFFCLKDNRKLSREKKGCKQKDKLGRFDIFAHNSINSPGTGPSEKAILDDNATAADMHKLVDVVRAAEKRGTVGTGGKHPVWSTELWYESKPPEKKGSPLQKHARHYAEALYLLWKQKVSAGIFLQLRDSPYDPSTPAVIGLQSGVYFIDGDEKPALDSVRFPFYAERKGSSKVFVWGKTPKGGKVKLQRKDGKKWETFATLKGKRGKVFKQKVSLSGKHKIRAAQGSLSGAIWKVK